MKIALPNLGTSHLVTNEEATHLCQTALELKDREDYAGAQQTMLRLWPGIGHAPETEGLHPSVAAEVRLCAGVLTSWIGSRNQIEDAQETAKNLITESISYFESVNDVMRIAAASVEIAYCYWRSGEADEARTMLHEALKRLTTEGTTRARALLKLTTVEWTAGRYYEAFEVLTANSTMFQKLRNHAVRGAYHGELAIVLRNLATAENRPDFFERAIKEYQQADTQFRLARNPIFRADVKNNVGLLLYKLERYKAAHKYLIEARRLSVTFKDKARTAQFDETRAQVFIAEGKYKDAENVARKAAVALGKSGRQRLVACALITQGIALARLGRAEHALFTFQKAIEIALQVGAMSAAGMAALTMIEEINQLPTETLKAAYQQAQEWLTTTQSKDILKRLTKAGVKALEGVQSNLATKDALSVLLPKPGVLEDQVREYESGLIKQALIQANGSVTHAASLLGMSYQHLCYMLETRHKSLQKQRSPIRRRNKPDNSDQNPKANSFEIA